VIIRTNCKKVRPSHFLLLRGEGCRERKYRSQQECRKRQGVRLHLPRASGVSIGPADAPSRALHRTKTQRLQVGSTCKPSVTTAEIAEAIAKMLT
jgi:hypothetical protein